MKAFGQLIHVEEVHRDGVKYRIAVFRVRGGLQGKWSCEACDLDYTQDQTNPTLDECLASIKDTIEKHHAAKHSSG
jgi:predicted RNase H-like HicB family nuclease